MTICVPLIPTLVCLLIGNIAAQFIWFQMIEPRMTRRGWL